MPALTFIACFLGSVIEPAIAVAPWLDAVRSEQTTWDAVADRFRVRLDEKAGATLDQPKAVPTNGFLLLTGRSWGNQSAAVRG